MVNMNKEFVGAARGFAEEIHKNQKRKFGTKESYINHPRRVSERCKDMMSKCIAWLHDTVEDGKKPEEIIKQIEKFFPGPVADGVKVLTRVKEQENYADYIIRLLSSPPVVLAVKLADLEDNMSDLKEGSMKDKYRLAHYLIQEELTNKADITALLNSKEECDGEEG